MRAGILSDLQFAGAASRRSRYGERRAMKLTRLLNGKLSYVISRMEQTASITLCDAGLPIPPSATRIDVAIEPGYPSSF